MSISYINRKRKGVNMKELISIIVPVYNVEKYLDKCIQSLINQTYKNIEIILIDDGSTDSSGKICDEWAKKDKRILRRFAVVSGFVEEGQKPGIPLDFRKEFFYHGVINSDQCTRE